MHVGSLFACIGGIDKGFVKAGFNIMWANEIDQNACITYNYNFSHKVIQKDIQKLQYQEGILPMNNQQQLLIDELIKYNYKKNSIKSIVQKHNIKEADLKRFYTLTFFNEIAQYIDLTKLTDTTITVIENQTPMFWADSLNDEECKQVKLDNVLQYKENWNVIKDNIQY